MSFDIACYVFDLFNQWIPCPQILFKYSPNFFLYLLLSSFSWPRFESYSWVRILSYVLVKYSTSWNWIFCSLGLVFNSLAEQFNSNSSNMLVTRCTLLKLSESVISRNNCDKKNAERVHLALVFLNFSYSFEKFGSADSIKWGGGLISARALCESLMGVLPVSKYFPTQIQKSFSAPMIFMCCLTFLKRGSIN